MANSGDLSDRAQSVVTRNKAGSLAVKICLVYSCVAGIWVAVADKVLGWVFPSSISTATLRIYGELGFIIVSASLLYLLSRILFRREAAVIDRQSRIAAVQSRPCHDRVAGAGCDQLAHRVQ